MKKILLMALAVSLAGGVGPLAAAQCARVEQFVLARLDRALARCGGDPACASIARDRCIQELSHDGCDPSLCGLGSPGPGDMLGGGSGDVCAFNTAEGASTAINQLLASQVLPVLNADWPARAIVPPPEPTGVDPYSPGRQEVTVDGGCTDEIGRAHV